MHTHENIKGHEGIINIEGKKKWCYVDQSEKRSLSGSIFFSRFSFSYSRLQLSLFTHSHTSLSAFQEKYFFSWQKSLSWEQAEEVNLSERKTSSKQTVSNMLQKQDRFTGGGSQKIYKILKRKNIQLDLSPPCRVSMDVYIRKLCTYMPCSYRRSVFRTLLTLGWPDKWINIHDEFKNAWDFESTYFYSSNNWSNFFPI